jgi:glycosyltransferase involved in cell wall biosynthesis
MQADVESKCLVSIVINNYNYAAFLPEAIDSALNQNYPYREVIVVDDGSQDDSQTIIKSYGDHVVPVFKTNGGQGSAFNAGFAAAQGDIVLFLDSDDVLLPDTIRRVVAAFESGPEIAKVQYRLQVIESDGTPRAETSPFQHWPMPSGDLRQRALKYPNYIFPPTSGNAFSAKALSYILPMDEACFRISADIYVNELAILLGPLASLDQVGGYYRMHGKNNIFVSKKDIDIAETRRYLLKVDAIHAKKKDLIEKFYPDTDYRPEKTYGNYLMARLISLKLDPENHPYAGDNLAQLCLFGSYHALRSSQNRRHVAVLLSFWYLAMLFAPISIAKQMTNNLLNPQSRGWLLNQIRKVAQWMG